jgi:AcrR family transcriptional regulator
MVTQRRSVGRRPRGEDSGGRERLLDTAIELFARKGIANTALVEIAEASQVTKAMIFYSFDSRDKLLDAIVDERIKPIIRTVCLRTHADQTTIADLIYCLVQATLKATQSNPWLPSLWFREILLEGGLLHDRVLATGSHGGKGIFLSKFTEAQAVGKISTDIMPELLFQNILALSMLPNILSDGATLSYPGNAISSERLQNHVISLLMNGVSDHSWSQAC